MMGRTHAASGLAAAAVTLPIAASLGANPVVWAGVWVGAAMLPDMDSGGSHAARVWGWPTRVAGAWVGKAAGGHRESTHDIVVSPLAVTLLFGFAALWRPAAIGVVALLFGIAFRMTIAGRVKALRNPVVNFAASTCAAWWLLTEGPIGWLPFVAAAGVIVHILCDSVTVEGAPLPVAWIWDRKARSIQWGARVFRTGTGFDTGCRAVFNGAAVLFVALFVVVPSWPDRVATLIGGVVS